MNTEGHQLMIKLFKHCMAYGKSLANSTTINNETSTERFCPVVFDGYLKKIITNSVESTANTFSYLCWGPTPSNTTVIKSCPNYVIGYDGNLMASKLCLADGSWFKHPESNREWSNYTTCINHNDYHVISQMLPRS